MGNVWGIAAPLALPAIYTAGSDVACPSATETTVLNSGTISSPGPGNFYPFVWGALAVLLGATPPTSLIAAIKIGAGSDITQQAVPVAMLVANATLLIPLALVGANSATAWIGAGSVLNITLNPAAQAVTFKQIGSQAIVALFRGPDQ